MTLHLALDFEPQTVRELVAVADSYNLSPQEFISRSIEMRLDECETINPQLDCWLGRYVPLDH